MRATVDQADPLLLRSRQVAGCVHHEDQRDVVGIVDADEAGGLVRRLGVQAAGQHHRLVCDHADRLPVDARVGGDDVGTVVPLHLKDVLVVEDAGQHVHHVVTGVRVVRDDRVQFLIPLRQGVVRRPVLGQFVEGRGGQEVQQVLHVVEGLFFIGGDVADVAVAGLLARPAQLLHGDLLTGHGLDDCRAGDEHLGAAVHGDEEVRRHRGVDRTTCGGPQQDRDLRALAGKRDLAARDLGVHGQGGHGVLNAGATGVVDADDRDADAGGHVHDLGDLLAEGLTHGAAENGLVVGVDRDGAAANAAVAGNHAVAVGGTRVARGLAEGTDLGEGALVEEGVDALARGGQPGGVALGLRRLGAGVLRQLEPALQVLQLRGHTAVRWSSIFDLRGGLVSRVFRHVWATPHPVVLRPWPGRPGSPR